ncbi:MAG: hypothetical protein H6747_05955 [Deltaproteobacteria bacterium]|nr:hypothetical protein [Deltaproteobacteria bacterium]
MSSSHSDREEESIEWLLQLIHQLSGPLSAMSLEVATIEELLEPRLRVGHNSDDADLIAAISGLKQGLDQSIDRFHAVRSQLLRERERRAAAEA